MTVQLAPHVNLQKLLPADAKRRRLSPGETLLAPGEHPKTIWFIAQGSVRSLAALHLRTNGARLNATAPAS